jgi:Predicted membrane protein
MKRLLSTACSETAFNVSVLVIRVTFGLMLLLNHGITKLKTFGQKQHTFFDPFHLGSTTSLMLVLFAEVFCVVFVILGLFTRVMVIPIVITFLVVVFMANKGQPFAKLELPVMFLAAFTSILLMGSGKYSVDGAMGK